jgi:putative copper export protein
MVRTRPSPACFWLLLVLVAGAARRGAAGVGLAFAAVLGVAALARLYAQSLAVHGPGAATDPLRLGHLLTGTLWGWGWLVQVAAVLLVAVGFAVARRGSQAGGALAGLAALMLAAGVWLGCLLVLLLAGIPASVRLGAGRGWGRWSAPFHRPRSASPGCWC